MPKVTTDPKFLINASRRKDVKRVTIFRTKDEKTKFKIRTSRYLYTLTLPNKRAEMFLKIVPRGLVVMKGHGVPKSA
ncbi:hypothetical protein FNF27_06836 [Cafeteria roenbergensis]|uniref:Ribosomal protein L38e n=1 Tax=Cafeteria roenbergensis TaxID=33653 RepID=A0A5A8C4C2_CAFRO|nr:hypothetical protein FNF31_07591 [Cafeteria roenbergensis]KAA0149754.1 hypothetical protein FNF29_05765 [Cafeteria roenbergensis]KAA0160907.1 hypothetical protein FNF28_05254 [Cafeteria roenbergensis]KAA0169812.1 hypothetical protein FNF27_06836 [Cafeteria roenbergensis]|eukprot:KAA0149754.1 hypothetical protein FNF29_05765 [Cafeteria roenbergensis]